MALALALLACRAPVSSALPTPLPTGTPTATAVPGPAPTAVPTLPAPGETAAPPASQTAVLTPANVTETPVPPEGCQGDITHPVGQSISERYDVLYDDVMGWYCAGSAFEDILLALETNAQSNVSVADLLARRAAGQSWNSIWRDIGLLD